MLSKPHDAGLSDCRQNRIVLYHDPGRDATAATRTVRFGPIMSTARFAPLRQSHLYARIKAESELKAKKSFATDERPATSVPSCPVTVEMMLASQVLRETSFSTISLGIADPGMPLKHIMFPISSPMTSASAESLTTDAKKAGEIKRSLRRRVRALPHSWSHTPWLRFSRSTRVYANDFRLSPKRDVAAAKAFSARPSKHKDLCRARLPSTDTRLRIGPFVSFGPKIETEGHHGPLVPISEQHR